MCDHRHMPSGRSVHGDLVVVPDVVGMVVDDARAHAYQHGVHLAPLDADGPPLAALTWQTPFRVTSQDPPAGTPLPLWHSVVVTWSSSQGFAGVREPRRLRPRTLPDAAAELPQE